MRPRAPLTGGMRPSIPRMIGAPPMRCRSMPPMRMMGAGPRGSPPPGMHLPPPGMLPPHGMRPPPMMMRPPLPHPMHGLPFGGPRCKPRGPCAFEYEESDDEAIETLKPNIIIEKQSKIGLNSINNSVGEAPEEIKIEKSIISKTVDPKTALTTVPVRTIDSSWKGKRKLSKGKSGHAVNPINIPNVINIASTSAEASTSSANINSEFPYQNFKKRKIALLDNLLGNEIRHERNVLLQCVKHVVSHNFFIDQKDN